MRNNHDDKTITVRKGNSIAYYRLMDGMQQFWDDHWREQRQRAVPMLTRSAKGHLGRGTVAAALVKHLPRSGVILEAGCGLGQYVLALRARGYDCRGIDFAEETVQWLRNLYPTVPISRGDILNLPFADGSIAAYLSFGVVEHFEDGPDRALHEARRVLVDGGHLVLSVPQVFPARWHRALPETTAIPHGYRFYQYAFSPRDFHRRLTGVGFAVIAEYGYSSAFGIELLFPFTQRLPVLRRAVQLSGLAVDHSFLWPLLARMRLFVAVKTGRIPGARR